MAFQYTMVSYGGIAPSLEAGLTGGSLSVTKVAIWKSDHPDIIGDYVVLGMGTGIGAATKVALFSGPSSTSDFESKVNGVDKFWGAVDSYEVSAAALIGVNYQALEWTSGPAAGTRCAGSGWVTLIGASIGGTASKLSFKFTGITNANKLKRDLNFKGLQLGNGSNGSSIGFSFPSAKPPSPRK